MHRGGTSTGSDSTSDEDNGGDEQEGASANVELEEATQKRVAISGYLMLHRVLPL